MKALKSMLLAFTLLLLINCKSDDDTPTPAPNYKSKLVGLWELDNPINLDLSNPASNIDAFFFTEDDKVYPVTYGELNTKHLYGFVSSIEYTYNDNNIFSFVLGENVPFDGSSSFQTNYEGTTYQYNKSNTITSLDDITNTLNIPQAQITDISTLINNNVTLANPNYNFDALDDNLLVPNPSNNSYLKFDKSSLNFVEEVTGMSDNLRSISVYDINPSELISVLTSDQYRIFQLTNPAFHPLGISDIVVSNFINAHTTVNNGDRNLISYVKGAGNNSFTLYNINAAFNLQGTGQFQFYNSPTTIRGMDYVDGQNKLIFSDAFGVHIFNIGFNAQNDDVSQFTHLSSHSIIPHLDDDTLPFPSVICGLHYDNAENKLFLVIKGGEDDTFLVSIPLNI